MELYARFFAGIDDSPIPRRFTQHWREGVFKEAGLGRGADLKIDKNIRSDEIKWLDPDKATTAQALYWQAIEGLRVTLNQQLFLGLGYFEAHMTVYKAGSYYARHGDQFRGIGVREVTAILYLNDNWQPDEGGALLLYDHIQTKKPYSIFAQWQVS